MKTREEQIRELGIQPKDGQPRRVHFSLDGALLKELDLVCKDLNVTRVSLVEALIRKFLKEK